MKGLHHPWWFLAGAVLLALAGSIVFRQGVDDRETIRFWNGFTGPDGRTMLALVRRFNEENPDVRVLMQRMDWGTYYNKLFVAGIGGRAPDVFVIHTDTLGRFHRGGFLRPLDDLARGKKALPLDDFDDHLIRASVHGDRLVAVPLDVHPLGMFYNRRLFRQAGIVDETGEPKPPSNREEFLSALEKLKRGGNGSPVETWGFAFTWLRTNFFTLMGQFGATVFDEHGTRVTVDSPEAVAALEFAADLIHGLNLAPPPEAFDSWIGFRQGRVGIVFDGIYMLPDLLRQGDLDYGAAPAPVLGHRPGVWANSHNLCLRDGLDGPKLEAAWRFVRFLSDHSLDWAESGQIPVRKSLRGTDRFRQMETHHQFARQMDDLVFPPPVPFVLEYMSELELAVERALRGTMPPRQALETAAGNIERIVRRQERGMGGEAP